MTTRLSILLLLIVALSMPSHADDGDADEIRQLRAKLRLLESQVKSLQETVRQQKLVIAKLKTAKVVEDPHPTSQPAVETKAPPPPKTPPKKAPQPKQFRNIRQIVSKVPTKIHPKPGNHWDDLRMAQFNEWAKTYTANGTIELTLVILAWKRDAKDGKTVFRVAFEDTIAYQRLDIKYRINVGATFAARQINKLLKHNPGDRVKVKGHIEKFRMRSSYTETKDTEKTGRDGSRLKDSDGNVRQRVIARWAFLDLHLVDATIK